ncbi:MAG: DNRLRE domain-containing protein [Syntrophomonas sp.]
MARKEIQSTHSTYISKYYANQNFGVEPYLYFGQYKQAGDIYRSLIKFSLRSIPHTAKIYSAQVIFTIYRNEIQAGKAIFADLQAALNPWSEFSVTWNSQPLFSHVNSFYLSPANVPGSSIAVDATSLVINWQKGLIANDGFVITGNEASNSLIGIYNTFPAPVEHRPIHHDHHKHHHHGHHHHRHHGTDIAPRVFVENPPGSLHFVDSARINIGPRLLVQYT